MSTKYIINNVTGQTITGDLRIEGNLIITGTSNTNGIATYKALLTQTASLTGTNISNFNYGFIIGETYTITNYIASDDFSNIANVLSGNINETGCVFIATGETPVNWSNGSEIVSSGNFIVDVLENTLGYDLDWSWKPFGGYGYYVAVNDNTGPIINSFPRNSVELNAQITQPADWGFPFINIIPSIISFFDKDNAIIFSVIDYDVVDSTDNALYYTPIEINIKQDLDETPIVLSGTVTTGYPFYNPSVDLLCGGNYVGPSYYGPGLEMNDLAEVISTLNGDSNTNVLGVYGQDGENITLTMKSNLKNQFCPSSTLTFEVFND